MAAIIVRKCYGIVSGSRGEHNDIVSVHAINENEDTEHAMMRVADLYALGEGSVSGPAEDRQFGKHIHVRFPQKIQSYRMCVDNTIVVNQVNVS